MQLLRGKDPRVERLAGVIARAALDPAAWQDVLAALGAAFPGLKLQFWGTDGPLSAPPLALTHGYEPAFLESFATHFRHINPWWPASLGQAEGRVWRKSDLVDETDVETTEFYNDWVRPQDDTIGGGGLFLHRSDSRNWWIGGAVPRRHREVMETDLLRLLSALAPALRHALQVNREILGLRTELAATRAGMDTTAAAVLLLDRDRRVLFANDAASALLSAGHHVAISPRGTVVAEALAARASLDRLASLQRPGTERILSFARSEIRVMHLLRLPADQIASLNALPDGLAGPPASILMVSSADPVTAQDSPLIVEHGLTPAEAEVVVQLAFGRSPREIADLRQASVHTVRNQIKAALAKTGLRRQSELAVLAARARMQ